MNELRFQPEIAPAVSAAMSISPSPLTSAPARALTFGPITLTIGVQNVALSELRQMNSLIEENATFGQPSHSFITTSCGWTEVQTPCQYQGTDKSHPSSSNEGVLVEYDRPLRLPSRIATQLTSVVCGRRATRYFIRTNLLTSE